MSKIDVSNIDDRFLRYARRFANSIPSPPPRDEVVLRIHSYDHKYSCSNFSATVQDRGIAFVDIVFRLEAAMNALGQEPLSRTPCCGAPYKGILKQKYSIGVVSMMAFVFCRVGNYPNHVQIEFVANIAIEMAQSYPYEVVAEWVDNILFANNLELVRP